MAYYFRYNEHHEPMPIDEFLAYALEKNDGDMHAALWDITIATKFLTRNNPVTGELNQDAYSGWFALTLLEDPFSPHYTAADVSGILSDRQYWDLGYFGQEGNIGNKDFDPANISGTPYHMLNLIALMGELPTSSPVAGLFYDWFYLSIGENDHGYEKLSGQVQYLSNNLGPIKQYLDSLPSNPSDLGRTGESTSQFILLNPFDKDLMNPQDDKADLWKGLTDGNVVKVEQQDGQIKFLKLHGSNFHPYIKVAETMAEAQVALNATDVGDSSMISSAELWGTNVLEVLKDTQEADTVTWSFDKKMIVQFIYLGKSGEIPVVVDEVTVREVLGELQDTYLIDIVNLLVQIPIYLLHILLMKKF